MRTPLIKNPIIDLNLRVRDIIDPVSRRWNVDLVHDLFYMADASLILANQPVVWRDDFWVWRHNPSDDYSLKSGYFMAYNLNKEELIKEAEMKPSLNDLKNQVWSLKAPPKTKYFLWRVLCEIILVADVVLARGIKMDSRCQIYDLEGKSMNHALFTCSIARQVWSLSLYPCPKIGFNEESIYENVHHLLSNVKGNQIPVEISRSFPWILWYLWKNKNKFLFEGKSFMANDIVDKILEESECWFQAQNGLLTNIDSDSSIRLRTQLKWKLPPDPWLKCNIGFSWSNIF